MVLVDAALVQHEMAREGEKIRGYLVISAREANGKNKEEKVVWDPNFVEGFVKGA